MFQIFLCFLFTKKSTAPNEGLHSFSAVELLQTALQCTLHDAYFNSCMRLKTVWCSTYWMPFTSQRPSQVYDVMNPFAKNDFIFFKKGLQHYVGQ